MQTILLFDRRRNYDRTNICTPPCILYCREGGGRGGDVQYSVRRAGVVPSHRVRYARQEIQVEKNIISDRNKPKDTKPKIVKILEFQKNLVFFFSRNKVVFKNMLCCGVVSIFVSFQNRLWNGSGCMEFHLSSGCNKVKKIMPLKIIPNIWDFTVGWLKKASALPFYT